MTFDSKLKVQLQLALGLSLISGYSITLPAFADESAATVQATSTQNVVAPENIAIRNIYINDNKQLVVEFDNPGHLPLPSPEVRDYPGQQHDIVLEFPQTSFAVDKTPKAKVLLDQLMKVYPSINSIAYASANDGKKARIRVGLSPQTASHPALVNMGEDSAVISLDLSETVTPAIANKDANTDVANSTTSQITVAAAPAKAPPSSGAGMTTKAANNIKDQVNKLAKFGDKINPLGKFGFGKKNSNPSTPANPVVASAAPTASSAAESSPDTAKPAESNVNNAPTAISPSVNSLPSTSDAINSASSTSSSTVTPAAAAAPTTVSSTREAVTSTPVSIAPTVTEEPKVIQPTTAAGVTTAANPSALKPEISSSQPTQPEVSTAATDNTAQPITPIETLAAQPVLPRIATTPDGAIADKSNEPLVTPLSVEDVLKEKTNIAAQSIKPASPDTSVTASTTDGTAPKESSTANPVVTDLKTSSAELKTDAKVDSTENKPEVAKDLEITKDKKDEPEKIASISTGDALDTLTNAALKNKSEAESDIPNPAAMPNAEAVKLKAQRARIGGKDYLPPKFADDAVEHYNAAVQFHLNGKLVEAAAEYQAAVEADPKIAEAYSNLGLIYNQQRKYDQAMDAFHKALLINPKDAITYNGIGAAMRAQNNMIAAVKNWKTAITIDPNLASAHYNLGTAYELQKDYDKALGEYKEAIKHDDKLGEAYYRMGLILQKMDNKNLALQEYKNAVKISQQATYVPDAKRRINLLSQTKNQSM